MKWSTTTLSEISESVDYGVTASARTVPTRSKFLRITDIQDGAVCWDSVPYCECGDKEAREKSLRDGDIVFARTGATTGKSFRIIDPPSGSVFASYLIRIRPKGDIDPGFLSSFFQTEDYWRQIGKSSTGTAQGGVNSTKLKKLQIPLPPLAEQKRIAGILDAADGLRAKRRAALAQLDTLLQSTFLDLFGDPVTNPKGWETYRLGVLGEVITGNTPSRKCPEFYGDEIEWIKSDNINDPSFKLTKAEEKLSSKGKEVARLAPEGSILVTCIAGSKSCIGNAAIADHEVAFNQQINAFVPNSKIELWFAFGLFLVGKRLIQRASTNSMKGMVSKSSFSGVEVPLPPLDLQRRFATIVESVERQKARHREHLAQLETLFASLQQRAFKGEL